MLNILPLHGAGHSDGPSLFIHFAKGTNFISTVNVNIASAMDLSATCEHVNLRLLGIFSHWLEHSKTEIKLLGTFQVLVVCHSNVNRTLFEIK